jgi:hypothetical protein
MPHANVLYHPVRAATPPARVKPYLTENSESTSSLINGLLVKLHWPGFGCGEKLPDVAVAWGSYVEPGVSWDEALKGGAFMAKIARALVLTATLAALAAACADNRPRNGAGEAVDKTTGTTAPGATTSK